MKPIPPEPDTKTLILITSAGGGDDDDDFQNPAQAIAISQNLILSSLKNPSFSQPLKPSNGAPPRKKQKASVSNGKENRRAPSRTQTSGNPRFSRVREGKKTTGEERRILSDSGESNLVEICHGNSTVSSGKKVVGEERSDLSAPLGCGSVGMLKVNEGSHGFMSNELNLGEKWKIEEIFHGNCRASSVCEGKKAVGEERSDRAASLGCGSVGMSEVDEGSHNLVSNESNLGEKWKIEENAFKISTVTGMFVEHETEGEKRRILSTSSHCASNDKPISNVSNDELGEEKLSLLTSEDSQIVENSQTEEFVRVDYTLCKDNVSARDEKSCLLTSSESKLAESLKNGEFDPYEDTGKLKEEKRSYYSMSIESRLLRSGTKSDSSNVEADCRDFDPGTQLNVLMDLCCEEGSSSSRDLLPEGNDLSFDSSELLMDGFVDCPLCGTDITGLSEELRQVHTNNCLDKDETPEGATPVGKMKSDKSQKIVDVKPVVEWLQALGLSRYEENFIREEVDWETLQWLTEEDLLNIGVVTLGPRKKILHALNDLRQKTHHVQAAENDISNTSTEGIKLRVPGNKMITEFFKGPSVHKNNACSLSAQLHGLERTTKDSTRKRVGPKNHASRGKRDIPPWCCIPGTPFRVDAFRFLRGDCTHWFLTHFHMDHYQGLTRNFCHGKIYCSSITAHLVNMKIGVPWERLQVLPLNQKVNIAGVSLICLDANHCPGSIIILFEPPSGKAVLHTGDFRFSAEMTSSSVLQTCHVDTLILDTTYCNPQYDFPKQEAVIQFVIEAIQAEAFNPKTLFLIGSYTIGKERLFLEVARLLRRKLYVGAAKLRLLRCLGLPEEDMQWFTANEMESHIHVVPMWTIASFKRMKHLSNQYSDRFNLIVAFSPTGWTFGKGKKKTPGRRWQQGTIIRYEVPYSEHSSFTELREFVRFISPQHIIPSVNNEGPESADAMIALLMSDP
ncbi:putative DNA cross-link repair 1A protein [Iris pallida]|uniref:DNA cross-link repair 1A protein n=1 Tax=Iris pallida TaxID=29817 RepID=A0AAX6G7B3_IRIPA|nr:putative DNA cross-link repair 1A protein [Iris pallida]